MASAVERRRAACGWRCSTRALGSGRLLAAQPGPSRRPRRTCRCTTTGRRSERLHTRLQTVDVLTEHTGVVARASRARLPGAGAARSGGARGRSSSTRPRWSSPTGTYDRVAAVRGLDAARRDGRGRRARRCSRASLVAPGDRVALAGAGPLLLVVADALLRSGVEVVVVAESGHPTKYGLHPASWSGLGSRSREAAAYAAALARHRVPYLAALGDPRRPRVRPGRGVTLATATRSHPGLRRGRAARLATASRPPSSSCCRPIR